MSHKNGALVAWNIVLSILTVLSAFSNLHVTAFSSHDLHDHTQMFKNGLVFWQVLQEYVFAIDIIIIFFTEFKDMNTGYYCRHPMRIALNYLRTTLIIDFLAFFPFFYVFSETVALDDGNE